MLLDRLIPGFSPERFFPKITQVDITKLGFRPRITTTGKVEEITPGTFLMDDGAYLSFSYHTKRDEQGRRKERQLMIHDYPDASSGARATIQAKMGKMLGITRSDGVSTTHWGDPPGAIHVRYLGRRRAQSSQTEKPKSP